MTRTLANQWDDPPHLDNRLLVILLISFSIFCYKLSIFGNFILQNSGVDLYTETLKLALFWLQNGGRLIHRFDLYTGKYGICFSIKSLKFSVSVSDFKMPVSASQRVSDLPFATPYIDTLTVYKSHVLYRLYMCSILKFCTGLPTKGLTIYPLYNICC